MAAKDNATQPRNLCVYAVGAACVLGYLALAASLATRSFAIRAHGNAGVVEVGTFDAGRAATQPHLSMVVEPTNSSSEYDDGGDILDVIRKIHPAAKHLTVAALEWRMAIGEQYSRLTHGPGTAPSLEEVLDRLEAHHVLIEKKDEGQEDAAPAHDTSTPPPPAIRRRDGEEEAMLLQLRIGLANALARRTRHVEPARVVFCATIGATRAGVVRDILPWILYHTELGVGDFFVLYDGTDATAIELLRSLEHVVVQPLHAGVVEDSNDDAAMRERYEKWAAMHWQWGNRPGNYALMVKQTFGMNEAIRWAKASRADWIMHIDPDEFVLPLFQDGGVGSGVHRSSGSTPALSFARYLHAKPPHVSSLRIFNAEAQPEHGYVDDKLQDVTLFKMNKAMLTFDAYAMRTKVRLGENRAYLILYANGKSAARVDVPNLRSLGPHFWKGDASTRWIDPANKSSTSEWKDALADDALILHYAYTKVDDVAAKAGRSCPGEEYRIAALQGNRTKVKECFVIDFDLDAFMVASTGDAAAVRRFFELNMVLREGARVQCRHGDAGGSLRWCRLSDVRGLIADLMRIGLLRREHGVQVVARMHDAIVQTASAALGRAPARGLDAVMDAAVALAR